MHLHHSTRAAQNNLFTRARKLAHGNRQVLSITGIRTYRERIMLNPINNVQSTGSDLHALPHFPVSPPPPLTPPVLHHLVETIIATSLPRSHSSVLTISRSSSTSCYDVSSRFHGSNTSRSPRCAAKASTTNNTFYGSAALRKKFPDVPSDTAERSTHETSTSWPP